MQIRAAVQARLLKKKAGGSLAISDVVVLRGVTRYRENAERIFVTSQIDRGYF